MLCCIQNKLRKLARIQKSALSRLAQYATVLFWLVNFTAFCTWDVSDFLLAAIDEAVFIVLVKKMQCHVQFQSVSSTA